MRCAPPGQDIPGARAAAPAPRARRLLRAIRDEAAEVLAEAPRPGSIAGRVLGAGSGLDLAIEPAWFGGEAHREGSACAC